MPRTSRIVLQHSGAAAPVPAVRLPRAGRAARWPVVALLLLAAAVRLYWGTRARVVWGDEPFYLWLGQSLVNGEGYQFFGISGTHFSPLFPLLAGAVGKGLSVLGVPAPQALAAGSVTLYVVCGSLLVLPIRGIAERLAGRSAGLAAGLAAALYPALTAGVPLWGTMTEPLYLLLIACAWWALLAALAHGRAWAFAAGGAALGLAYLTRTEALAYAAAAGGAAVVIELLVPDRVRRLRRLAAGLAVLVFVFGASISPYLVTLHRETGKWQLAEEAGSTYVSAQGLAHNDVAAFDRATWGLDPVSGEVYLFSPASEGQGLVDAIVADPGAFFRLVYANGRDLLATVFSQRLIPWPLLAVIALGLFARPWDVRRLRGELLLLASLAGPLSFLPFFIQDRYMAGALLPALVWLGGGAAWLGDWLADTLAGLAARLGNPAWRRLLTPLPALLLALALLWQGPRLWAALQRTNSFQPAHLAAAAALRERGVPADAVVMSRYPAIAFHAGTRWAPTPAAEWGDVLAYARRHAARYLAVDAWEIKLRPQLNALLDPAAAPAELEHVATRDSGAGPVLLYRVRP